MTGPIDNKFIFTTIMESKRTILAFTLCSLFFSLFYTFSKSHNYEYINNVQIPSKIIPVEEVVLDSIFLNHIIEKKFIFCETFNSKYDLINANYPYDLKSPVTIVKPTFFSFCSEMNMGPFFRFKSVPIYNLNYNLYSKISKIDECWQSNLGIKEKLIARIFSTNQSPDILNIFVNSADEKSGKLCMNKINYIITREFSQVLKKNIQDIEIFLKLKNSFDYKILLHSDSQYMLKEQYASNQAQLSIDMFAQVTKFEQNTFSLISANSKKTSPNHLLHAYLGLGFGFLLGLIISILKKLTN